MATSTRTTDQAAANVPEITRRRRRKNLDRDGLPFAAYIRVSTTGQAASGLGLDAQTQAITAWATAHGHDLTWFEDAGVSGGKRSRPGLNAALAAVAAGEVGGIVVSKLDRLGRNTAQLVTLGDEARERGWRLIALDLNLDTSTAAGAMFLSLMAALAAFERERGSERQRDKFRGLRQRGALRGAPATDRAVADDILAMRAEGQTYRKVADALNTRRVPTTAGAAKWWPASVRSAVLTRRAELDAQQEARAA